ncbi:MAG: hypothetical protein R3F36_05625 [Candidatus Competibacteraceae bacterium]
MIWTWRHSPVATRPGTHTVHGSAWRLFSWPASPGCPAASCALSLPDLGVAGAAGRTADHPARRATWQCAYDITIAMS